MDIFPDSDVHVEDDCTVGSAMEVGPSLSAVDIGILLCVASFVLRPPSTAELVFILGFNFEFGAAVTFNTEDRATAGGGACIMEIS
jgi:hypothetical protein